MSAPARLKRFPCQRTRQDTRAAETFVEAIITRTLSLLLNLLIKNELYSIVRHFVYSEM